MSCLALSPHVETPRLRLRGLRKADLPRLAELANDYDVAKMTGAMPFPYRLSDAEAFLARTRRLDPSCEAQFVVDQDGEPIGTLGFYKGHVGRCEVGYWLGRPYWGQGLATEALQTALVWARQDWCRKVVVAGHNVDNPASGQVLIKAGFLYTGETIMAPSRSRGCDVAVRMMVWLA